MKKNKTTKKKMPHPISGEVLHSDMSVDSQGQGKGSMKVKTLSVPGGGGGATDCLWNFTSLVPIQ